MNISQLTAGPRPAVTPVHVISVLIAGVPIVANLLAAFGIYHPTDDQQHALTQAMQWGAVFATALVGGDTGLRAARNLAGGPEHTITGAATASNDAASAVTAPDDADQGEDADALAHLPVHSGAVPPDRGDAVATGATA